MTERTKEGSPPFSLNWTRHLSEKLTNGAIPP